MIFCKVINKVDMPGVDVERVERQLQNLFDFCPDEMLRISAKRGTNVPALLDSIVDRLPAPKVVTAEDAACRAHVFDSWYGLYIFFVI